MSDNNNNTPRFTAHEYIDPDEGVTLFWVTDNARNWHAYFIRRKTCVAAAEKLNNGSMEREYFVWDRECPTTKEATPE